MPRRHSDETQARAQTLVATTPMPYAAIGAAIGVPGSSIGSWKRRFGWTRPPDAIHRKVIPKEMRRIGVMLRQAGVSPHKVSLYLECHLETARRLGREEGEAPPPIRLAEIAPREMAALAEALALGRIPHDDLLQLAELRFAVTAMEAIARGDLGAHRHAQAAARTYATLKALLPGDRPAAGASLHDHQPPAAADDRKLVLEGLARKIEAFAARWQDDGLPGDAAAGGGGVAP
jgi:hypothetical protein